MSKEKEFNAPNNYTRKQRIKFALARFRQSVLRPIRIAFALRPGNVSRLFKHIYNFAHCDKVIAGYKHAIHYGVCYFLESNYKNHQIDLQDRSRRMDEIIEKYSHPTDRLDYIDLLKETKSGLIKANNMGLIGSSDNKLNKIEAAHYQMAMDSVDILIRASVIYPRLWQRTFAPQS